MKKIILLCSVIMLFCYSCNLEELLQVPTNIEGYKINMPQISTNASITNQQLEQKFNTVVKEEIWETIIIKASDPKDKFPLFNTITYIYRLKNDKFRSVNVNVTYGPTKMNDEAKRYAKSKLKNLSLVDINEIK
jgi:hypothetical protein